MKAIIISQPGNPEVLKLVEIRPPAPGLNEVLIRVKAAGLNRLDIAQRRGFYPAPPGAPADIPGVEVSGIIEQCGTEVTQWKVGESVCALLSGGGYAEYVVADSGSCLPIPKGLSFIQAASLPEAAFTVWHNVFQRGQLKSDENFLVHGGTSGIGVMAIQLAKVFGAHVFSTAGSDEKCHACTDFGATRCINYKTHDFEKDLQSIGMDVILDMIGGDYITKEINIMRPEGRLILINAKTKELQGNVFNIMQKRLNITGSTLRSRDLLFKSALASEVLAHVWPKIEEAKVKPVVYKVFPLYEAAKAHQLMESGIHTGKIILEV
ncbi:NAD(P)H-quinone oxidoreductase [Pedobacter sp. P351]|uniref:NAD(P)H-quinone oxidoreductase n=1 Tax=Pedobacter superstes TaxID=3133441 RepID=UPI00309BE81C